MVAVDWTPTQANYVAGALTALLLLDRSHGILEGDDAGKLALVETVEAIDFQLAYLRWPKRNTTPFPV